MPAITRHIGRARTVSPGGDALAAPHTGVRDEAVVLPRLGRRPLGFRGSRLFTASAPARDNLPGFAISLYQCQGQAGYVAQINIQPPAGEPIDSGGAAVSPATVAYAVSDAAYCTEPHEVAAFLRGYDPAAHVAAPMPSLRDDAYWARLGPDLTDYLQALREHYRALLTAILPPETSTALATGVPTHDQHSNL